MPVGWFSFFTLICYVYGGGSYSIHENDIDVSSKSQQSLVSYISCLFPTMLHIFLMISYNKQQTL